MPLPFLSSFGYSAPGSRDGRSGAEAERRRAARRGGRAPAVVVTDVGGGDPVPGWVEDWSTGGLGLRAQAPAAIGALLLVRAASAPEDLPCAEVRVRGCCRAE